MNEDFFQLLDSPNNKRGFKRTNLFECNSRAKSGSVHVNFKCIRVLDHQISKDTNEYT